MHERRISLLRRSAETSSRDSTRARLLRRKKRSRLYCHWFSLKDCSRTTWDSLSSRAWHGRSYWTAQKRSSVKIHRCKDATNAMRRLIEALVLRRLIRLLLLDSMTCFHCDGCCLSSGARTMCLRWLTPHSRDLPQCPLALTTTAAAVLS